MNAVTIPAYEELVEIIYWLIDHKLSWIGDECDKFDEIVEQLNTIRKLKNANN